MVKEHEHHHHDHHHKQNKPKNDLQENEHCHHYEHGEHHHVHHHDHSSHSGHDHHDHCGHGGHGHHHHHGNFKKMFWQSLPIGLIIMLISPMGELTLPGQFTFPYSDIIALVLATLLIFVGGKPFFQGGLAEIKEGQPSMMALIGLGLSVAYLYSAYAILADYFTNNGGGMNFLFEFASLILIMLLGHWIEMQSVAKAGDAQESLAALLPKEARRKEADGNYTLVPISNLVVGDLIQVQAGENVPADGRIIKGQSQVNESLLTGESKAVEKEINDQVIGGSTNGDSVIEIEVERLGSDSFISQVQELVDTAQNQASRAENLANKVASYLFYIALTAAIIALIAWLLIADLPTALMYVVTTLVIACPHALGLAIPLVVARSTSIGAHYGILTKDRQAYELADKADVIVLDKTGTLTKGQFDVLTIKSLNSNFNEAEITGLLAGIESGSTHPIAQSLVQYAKDQNISPVEFTENKVISGQGVAGNYEGHSYQLISEAAYGENLDFDRPTGATVSVLVKDGEAIAAVALGDELKDSSQDLIQQLKEAGKEVIMATGDNENSASIVAKELGIEYYANQSPEDKYELVKELKAQDKHVIMVGDGVNDAPSLALADVGMAIGAGTQVALDSADVILTQSEPSDIQAFLTLARKTNRKMKENLAWGAGYNFIAIPLAAGLLAPIGITISPALGAILMSLSTVIVAVNAMTLRVKEDD
ncbi:copper-translocating P-type ATPase [Aerococcus kribbianus]|uniref:P-type Cu(+) transporter n=1 Tax=Aerococcus kribbianus TaxID=2999064 RepID=A0A9X3FM80_9LACT|nr:MULTISPECIES: copper-translocating P-type ATPase [unclassified Aerococcus]MCZ0716814.1 copper-translocating P-type ATPase [Aerococcus sp. YH-aer221]MCZ0725102.1 copper-translocating P-type ATPase [Aerococcus sp. YH-aer222]